MPAKGWRNSPGAEFRARWLRVAHVMLLAYSRATVKYCVIHSVMAENGGKVVCAFAV